jgi:hypothetical protein
MAARGVDDHGAVAVVREEAELDQGGGPREAEHGEVVAALDAAVAELRGREHRGAQRLREWPRGFAPVEHLDAVRARVLDRVHVQGDQDLRADELRHPGPRRQRRVVPRVLAREECGAAARAQRLAQAQRVAQGDLGLVEAEARLAVLAAGVVDPGLAVAHAVAGIDGDPHRCRLLAPRGADGSGLE